jgi:hypothetical protein
VGVLHEVDLDGQLARHRAGHGGFFDDEGDAHGVATGDGALEDLGDRFQLVRQGGLGGHQPVDAIEGRSELVREFHTAPSFRNTTSVRSDRSWLGLGRGGTVDDPLGDVTDLAVLAL